MLQVSAYCRNPAGNLAKWETGFTSFDHEAQIERLINDVTMEAEKEFNTTTTRSQSLRDGVKPKFKPVVLLLIEELDKQPPQVEEPVMVDQVPEPPEPQKA